VDGVGNPKPYVADLRYDFLTGGPEQRHLKYLMRRYLDFTPEETAAMPWHVQRMWIEGIAWERQGFKYDESTSDLDEIAGMGLNVRRVGD
jgi:hypothetical protein